MRSESSGENVTTWAKMNQETCLVKCRIPTRLETHARLHRELEYWLDAVMKCGSFNSVHIPRFSSPSTTTPLFPKLGACLRQDLLFSIVESLIQPWPLMDGWTNGESSNWVDRSRDLMTMLSQLTSARTSRCWLSDRTILGYKCDKVWTTICSYQVGKIPGMYGVIH
jgi:hypothetical protein